MKGDIDTLLADKVSNIGDISLPGMLDIGTSDYTNSRIRCNATVGGFNGYAELKAANSYDMFLNLSTTRTDGGWMYFKINNYDYIQLSGSDSKMNIYKDTSISSNLTINGDLDSSTEFPLDIKNSTIHTEFWTLASFHQGIENSGSWLQFSRDGTSNTLQAGMSSDNSYVIRASDATNRSTVNQNGDTTISGNLDVGPSQTQSHVKTYFNHVGSSGFMMVGGRYRDQGFLHFETNYQYGEMFITVRNTYFIRCSDYAGNPYVQTFQPLTQSSDDRLKENEELIENACETLSKLKPQLYDKKPDIDNDDPTTWYKESGLIAQEIYYDAPELRHLTHKGKPETDEDDNIIPLPEIQTSIDPQQDPDYSSSGKNPASINYIGLIAYLIKANTELHERAKALESK